MVSDDTSRRQTVLRGELWNGGRKVVFRGRKRPKLKTGYAQRPFPPNQVSKNSAHQISASQSPMLLSQAIPEGMALAGLFGSCVSVEPYGRCVR